MKPIPPQELPAWMIPRPYQRDYALLVIVIFCSVLALPWFVQDGLPASIHAEAQTMRFVAVAENLKSGTVYPRWADSFHMGYGSPILNYLAPLSHYLGASHFALTNSRPDASLRLVMILGIYIAGLGMYFFVRRQHGDIAGMIAAMAYLLCPIIGWTILTVEVDAGKLLAVGFFPWALWSIDRWLAWGNGRDWLGVVAFSALLILSHHSVSLLFLILLVMWAGVASWQAALEHRLGLLVGLTLAVGITAIYWLPAFAEQSAVHWITDETHYQPLAVSDLWQAAPYQLDDAWNRLPSASLGISLLVFALLGAVSLLQNGHAKRLLMFGVVSVGLIGVAVGLPSMWLDRVNQFPALTRIDLLLPVAACLAILVGQAVHAIEQQIANPLWRGFLLVGVLIALLGSAAPTLGIADFVSVSTQNPLAQAFRREQQGLLIGSMPYGQLLPRQVATLPPSSDALLDSYLAGSPLKVEHINRLPHNNLARLSHRPTEDAFLVNYSQPTTINVLSLSFSGWGATFQEVPLSLAPDPQTGLIRVEVPAGRGILRVAFSDTRPRIAALLVTVFCLLLVPLIVLWLGRQHTPEPVVHPLLPVFQKRMIGLLAAIALPLVLIFQQMPITPDAPFELTNSMPVAEGVQLVGMDMESVDDYLELTMLWTATTPQPAAYWFDVQWVAGNNLLHQSFFRAMQGWATEDWQMGTPLLAQIYLPWQTTDEATPTEIRIQAVRCDVPDSLYPCVGNPAHPVFVAGRGFEGIRLPVTIRNP